MKKRWIFGVVLLLMLAGLGVTGLSGCSSVGAAEEGTGGNAGAAGDELNADISAAEGQAANAVSGGTDMNPASDSASRGSRVQSGGEEDSGSVIEIGDKVFIAQTNDIYLNAEDFLGQTIRYQGIFDIYEEPEDMFYSVIRYGPGCCGNDGNVGFEIKCDDGVYPEQNDWVEVEGVLEAYTLDGAEYLRLQVSSLTVLDERGMENVVW